LLVVLLGGLIGWVLVSGSGGGSGRPSGGTVANPPVSGAAPTSHGQSPTGNSAPVVQGRPTSQQLADAITNYFQIVPGDLSAGWDLLTSHFQKSRAKNWATYQSYWNSVDHVDVTSVQGQPPHTATANLVYYYKNGQVVAQTTTFQLQRQDGVLKIAAES
jgi:hypothetical protein